MAVSSGAKIIPIPSSKEMRDKFEGGVMGSDGCIYCIPLRLSSTPVSSWPRPHTMALKILEKNMRHAATSQSENPRVATVQLDLSG